MRYKGKLVLQECAHRTEQNRTEKSILRWFGDCICKELHVVFLPLRTDSIFPYCNIKNLKFVI